MKTKVAALAGVVSGIALLLIGGGGAPAWLCNVQAAFFCSLSLLYGFSAFAPNAPFWLSSRPVLGIASVYMGVVVMWVPVNILASAFFLGLGIRLLTTDKPTPSVRRARTEVVAKNGDIVVRESGRIATVD